MAAPFLFLTSYKGKDFSGILLALLTERDSNKVRRSEQMGIIQFLLLSFIILVYLAIVGGLIARAAIRNANQLKGHNAHAQEEILI